MKSTIVKMTQEEFDALVDTQDHLELTGGPREFANAGVLKGLIRSAQRSGFHYIGSVEYDRVEEAA